jgi:multicomponent Na+:H+ antiporter subunit A
MTILLLAHLAVAAIILTTLSGRPRIAAAFGIAILAATAITTVVLGTRSDQPNEQWEWIAGLGLRFDLALDGFATMMVLIISLLGVIVLWYSIEYFSDHVAYVRFVGVFVIFAGAMTGLVMSADLFTMFVFWELTSVCSFLLIGLNDESAAARSSALRALLVTGAGGLCLLAGVILFQVATGTSSFSELAAASPDGTLITVAALLALTGAFTKSAQFPFHFWLPGAMSAPTPVSAYLHSATMVKAGIVLMARLAPIVGHEDLWRWTVVLAGGTTMIFGGIRAMRQTDTKLLLAHSTVSQLGFLTILVGLGVPGATYAGVAHLLAHAVFKAGLFLSVGIVDHATGTRDIRKLSGVGRSMPVVAWLTGLSAASMAGLIPLFGFATKEKSLVALLDADEKAGTVANVALILVIVGSVLSVAYSVRLMRGLFGTKPELYETPIEHPPSWFGLVLPMGLTVVASVIAGLFAATVGGWLDSPAKALDPAAYGALALWPGINTAFLISVGVVIVGAVLSGLIPIRPWRNPIKISGEAIFQFLFDGLMTVSKRITRVAQSGSLLAYNAIIFVVIIAALGAAVLTDFGAGFSDLVFADSFNQVAVVILASVFTVGIVITQQRFVAALLMGGLGFACALIFVMFGAPDLALTQILVETLIIVVFLLVLRQLPRAFEHRNKFAPRSARMVIALIVGVLMAMFTVMISGSRSAPTTGNQYTELALPEAGGKNIVNVILVDFRAIDTLGEITVLAVAAVGIANLVRMANRRRRAGGADPADHVVHDEVTQ